MNTALRLRKLGDHGRLADTGFTTNQNVAGRKLWVRQSSIECGKYKFPANKVVSAFTNELAKRDHVRLQGRSCSIKPPEWSRRRVQSFGDHMTSFCDDRQRHCVSHTAVVGLSGDDHGYHAATVVVPHRGTAKPVFEIGRAHV